MGRPFLLYSIDLYGYLGVYPTAALVEGCLPRGEQKPVIKKNEKRKRGGMEGRKEERKGIGSIPSIHHVCIHLLRAESLLEANEGEAVADIIFLDALDGLLAALDGDIKGLNHGLDLLLGSELQHGEHLGPVADVGAAHADAVGAEVLGHELGEGLVGEADVVEDAVDGEGGHVLFDVEGVGHVGRVEDHVEGEGPVLVPVLVLRGDEVLRSELLGVGFLVGGVRDGVDVAAEGGGPEEPEVS